jgi:hypothetical protein
LTLSHGTTRLNAEFNGKVPRLWIEFGRSRNPNAPKLAPEMASEITERVAINSIIKEREEFSAAYADTLKERGDIAEVVAQAMGGGQGSRQQAVKNFEALTIHQLHDVIGK